MAILRYIDAEGREQDVDDVNHLYELIQDRRVSFDSLVWDDEQRRWVAARDHEFFRRIRENERFAVTAIHAEDLLLADVTLKKEGAWWYLKGAITNNSKYALGKIGFLVTIQDCPQPQNCKVVGQEAASTNSGSYSYNDRTPIVPAGQVRLFSTYAMEFKNMPATNNPQWSYKITELRATW